MITASESKSLNSNPATERTLYLASGELPSEPLVIIEPTKGWRVFNIGELWAHRELLYFLTWRDLKVRYKQAVFGVAWAVLQPVLMTVIFTVFLGKLVRVPTQGVPYPLLAYSGLLPWAFFSTAILGSAQGLVANASLITKVYFPRVLIPTSNVLARLFDFGISFLILCLLLLYYRFALGYPISVTWNLLALPLLVMLLVLFSLGLGLLVSSLNVRYRDIGVALPVLLQLWMFASPIVYPVSLVPERWQVVYALNPLVGLIQGFRASLFGSEFPILAIAISTAFTFILLVVGSLVFKRTEKTFADVV